MTENNKPINYPIDREIFSDILAKSIDEDTLDILFNSGYESEKFKFWNDDDEQFILDKENMILINWYKRYHYGRCLISNMTEPAEYMDFFVRLVTDMEENNE